MNYPRQPLSHSDVRRLFKSLRCHRLHVVRMAAPEATLSVRDSAFAERPRFLRGNAARSLLFAGHDDCQLLHGRAGTILQSTKNTVYLDSGSRLLLLVQ